MNIVPIIVTVPTLSTKTWRNFLFHWQNWILLSSFLIGILTEAQQGTYIHTGSFMWSTIENYVQVRRHFLHQMASLVTPQYLFSVAFIYFPPKLWCTLKTIHIFVQLAWIKHRQLAAHQINGAHSSCMAVLNFGVFCLMWRQRGRG